MNDDLIRRSETRAALKGVIARTGMYGVSIEVILQSVPAVNAVNRDALIKKLFPLGVPRTREDWNYSINARAVYEAIMKTEG